MRKAGAKVIAFEALPDLAARLAYRVETAGYGSSILIVPLALSEQPGVETFYQVVGAEALSSFKPQETEHDQVERTVNVVRLDDIVFESVSFIKLDVEGAEFDVLKGARRILRSHRPVLAFEFGRSRTADRFGYSAEEFYQFFSELDYEIGDIFGTELTVDMWGSDWPLPWYAIGWPRDRDDAPMWQAIESVVNCSNDS